jgi:hypothetical protein
VTTPSGNIDRGPAVRIASIRTGAQTGVDRAALDYAVAHRIPYSGWCPRGGLAEDHKSPPGVLAHYPLLCETPSDDATQRTAWNVRDSHATLILYRGAELENSPGAVLTREMAESIFLRPCLALDIHHAKSAQIVRDWLEHVALSLNVERLVLNIAGPRESQAPGMRAETLTFLAELFQPFSLWLVPVEERRSELSTIINNLAARHHTPRFEPHVTLCSGNILTAGPPEELADRLDRCCAQLAPISAGFDRLGHTDRYLTYFFARLEGEGAAVVTTLQSRLAGALDAPGTPEIGLHLSLMYCEPDIAIDRSQLAREVKPRLSSRVLFDSVRLVMPARGDWRDVASWQIVHTAKLGA